MLCSLICKPFLLEQSRLCDTRVEWQASWYPSIYLSLQRNEFLTTGGNSITHKRICTSALLLLFCNVKVWNPNQKKAWHRPTFQHVLLLQLPSKPRSPHGRNLPFHVALWTGFPSNVWVLLSEDISVSLPFCIPPETPQYGHVLRSHCCTG